MPALLAMGIPVHNVAPTNQCAIVPGAFISFVRYTRSGKIHWPSALIAAPVATVAANFGARLNLYLPADLLKMIMIVCIPFVALIVLFKKDVGEENRVATLSRTRVAVTAVLMGLIIGGYQGFYGAGAGTFFMLAFAILIRLDLVTASGCTKLLLFSALFGAAVTYSRSGLVLWSLSLVGMICYFIGSYVGAGLALTKGAKVIRPMLMIVLTLLIGKLVFELFL